MGTSPTSTVNAATVQRRAAAREQARVVAGLVIEEVGRVPAEAQAAFWDELKKMLPLPKPAPPAGPKAEPLTDLQSRAFGRSIIRFGKHEGTPVDEIPLDYLEMLCEPQPFIRTLRRYLASTRISMETAHEGRDADE